MLHSWKIQVEVQKTRPGKWETARNGTSGSLKAMALVNRTVSHPKDAKQFRTVLGASTGAWSVELCSPPHPQPTAKHPLPNSNRPNRPEQSLTMSKEQHDHQDRRQAETSEQRELQQEWHVQHDRPMTSDASTLRGFGEVWSLGRRKDPSKSAWVSSPLVFSSLELFPPLEVVFACRHL